MNEIKCPHCQKVFTIDEHSYADIVSQVRNQEFAQEIHQQLELTKKQFETEQQLKSQQAQSHFEEKLAHYTQQIALLEQELKQASQQMEVQVEKEKHKLELELSKIQQEQVVSKQELTQQYQEKITQQDQLIQSLQAKIDAQETKEALRVSQLSAEKDRVIADLEAKNHLQEKEQEVQAAALKEKYELELRQKDETIAFYKDFKAKQSTKMIGESLEQHCEIQFNQLRMTAFPRAEFGKDNDAKTGSKGDYIYREYDDFGNEILSIMFEMKNENDETATKKKNEHFFKELDKDRREKNCEYAILVSLLEADNELYNNGIVDVSYVYEKMYVVRPQFFIPIITLLRNAALNSL